VTIVADPYWPKGIPQRQGLLGVVNWVFLGHRIVEEEYQGRPWLGCRVRAIARYLSGHLAGVFRDHFAECVALNGNLLSHFNLLVQLHQNFDKSAVGCKDSVPA
jgi:hypothetical protein